MECLRCGSEASPGKAMCESCLNIPRPKAQISRQMNDVIPKNIVQYVFGAALFLLLIVLAFSMGSSPVPFKGVSLNTKEGGQSELCLNKKGCIAVFLAPWCGSCRSHIGLVNQLADAAKNTDLGFEVIVGWSDEAQIKEFASEVKTKVFVDTNNQFRSRLSFSSVPRWFVVNAQQEITKSFFPSYLQGQTELEILKYVVNDKASELSPLLN